MNSNFEKIRADEIKSEGALAFEEGKFIYSNPYKIGWDKEYWIMGYKDAEEYWVLSQSDYNDGDDEEYYD